MHDAPQDTVAEAVVAPGAEKDASKDPSGMRDLGLRRGAMLSFVAQIVGLVASFLIGILIARALGPVGKGVLTVVMQVPGLLAIILNFGVASANIYFVSHERVSARVAFANSLLLTAGAALVSAPVIMLLLRGPLAVVQGVGAVAAVCAMLSAPASLLAGWVMGIASGLGRLRYALWFSLASSGVTILGLVVMVVLQRTGVGFVSAISLAGTIVGITVVSWGIRDRVARPAIDLAALRAMVGYSVRSHLGGIAGYLHLRQDVLILGWLAGAGPVGIYSVGVSFAELMWYAPSALGNVILAKVARTSDDSAHDYVARSSRVSLLLMLVSGALAIVIVPGVIPLLFGARFFQSGLVFLILLPGVLADGVARIIWSYNLATDHIYWRESLVATAGNAILAFGLVRLFGIYGAAGASTVSYTAFAAVLIWRVTSDTGLTVGDLLLIRRDDVRLVSAGLRAMVGRLIPAFARS
jgi:O-antigen/teichoic acid export membrane protein